MQGEAASLAVVQAKVAPVQQLAQPLRAVALDDALTSAHTRDVIASSHNHDVIASSHNRDIIIVTSSHRHSHVID